MYTMKNFVSIVALQALGIITLFVATVIKYVVLDYDYTQTELIICSVCMLGMILICVFSGCLVIYASKAIKSD